MAKRHFILTWIPILLLMLLSNTSRQHEWHLIANGDTGRYVKQQISAGAEERSSVSAKPHAAAKIKLKVRYKTGECPIINFQFTVSPTPISYAVQVKQHGYDCFTSLGYYCSSGSRGPPSFLLS